MGYKYCCDGCGKQLDEHDNVANQLDMTGKAYCHSCLLKQPKKEPTIYVNKQEGFKYHKLINC